MKLDKSFPGTGIWFFVGLAMYIVPIIFRAVYEHRAVKRKIHDMYGTDKLGFKDFFPPFKKGSSVSRDSGLALNTISSSSRNPWV